MDKKELQSFLIKAREKTYAGGGGKVKPAFTGSYQLEHSEGDFFYRDVYNMGNGIFVGLETVYYKDKPVWSDSYFGNFKEMTEEETDKILRQALIANKETRLWTKVEWKKEGYIYTCTPDSEGNIDEAGGMEEIYKGDKRVYYLYYAGAFIG